MTLEELEEELGQELSNVLTMDFHDELAKLGCDDESAKVHVSIHFEEEEE